MATPPLPESTDLPAHPTVGLHQRPKSPPLAFARTSNDSLEPLIQPPRDHIAAVVADNNDEPAPSASAMGRTHHEALLEATIEQHTVATTQLHHAFQAERDAWLLERKSLYRRIANLEALLKSGNHDR